MKRILHILKDFPSNAAMELVPRLIEKSGREVTVILIQEAVRLTPSFNRAEVYVLDEDAKKRGVASNLKTIDYPELLERIYAADTVIAW